MPSLFESAAIGNLELKNRMVRSATWEGMCEKNGRPTPKLIQLYENLAKGGIGLIISGYTYVRPDGKQNPGKAGLYSDEFKNEFKAMTRAVHDQGGKIAIQLVHAGALARPNETGLPTVAPSSVENMNPKKGPFELSVLQIEDISDGFAQAAGRAREWGFDGIQIHGAHGYLVSQFLCPANNRRTDEYGGSLENRGRFLMDVYSKIRSRVGKDFPVFIKMNAHDHIENGLTLEESCQVAARLSQAGMDAIEVSSGSPAAGAMGPVREKIDAPQKEAYNLDLTQEIKKHVTCPVISVGGIRSLSVARDVIADKKTDFIALARPLIREPDLADKWKSGESEKAACISCNRCFMQGMSKGGITCPVKIKQKA